MWRNRIRENITPRGDGNLATLIFSSASTLSIRENITPRGDGNSIFICTIKNLVFFKIRENITPRGDGNPLDDMLYHDDNLCL